MKRGVENITKNAAQPGGWTALVDNSVGSGKCNLQIAPCACGGFRPRMERNCHKLLQLRFRRTGMEAVFLPDAFQMVHNTFCFCIEITICTTVCLKESVDDFPFLDPAFFYSLSDCLKKDLFRINDCGAAFEFAD